MDRSVSIVVLGFFFDVLAFLRSSSRPMAATATINEN
jgi:hypothetical protein